MNQQRADEIIRKVIYANLGMFPTNCSGAAKDFHIGRMVGNMQRILEIELAKEVEKEAENE